MHEDSFCILCGTALYANEEAEHLQEFHGISVRPGWLLEWSGNDFRLNHGEFRVQTRLLRITSLEAYLEETKCRSRPCEASGCKGLAQPGQAFCQACESERMRTISIMTRMTKSGRCLGCGSGADLADGYCYHCLGKGR